MDLHLFDVTVGETAELLAGRHLVEPGGKGANQARAAARLGAEVLLIGRVGGDLGAPRGEIATRLARHGGFDSERARVRLMAIGSRAGPHRGHVLTHGHVLRFVEGHVAANLDALNAMEVGDPVVAFLELVRKARGGLPA